MTAGRNGLGMTILSCLAAERSRSSDLTTRSPSEAIVPMLQYFLMWVLTVPGFFDGVLPEDRFSMAARHALSLICKFFHVALFAIGIGAPRVKDVFDSCSCY